MVPKCPEFRFESIGQKQIPRSSPLGNLGPHVDATLWMRRCKVRIPNVQPNELAEAQTSPKRQREDDVLSWMV